MHLKINVSILKDITQKHRPHQLTELHLGGNYYLNFPALANSIFVSTSTSVNFILLIVSLSFVTKTLSFLNLEDPGRIGPQLPLACCKRQLNGDL
jgi:hypothetical protein